MLKQIKDEIVDKSYAGELDGGSPSVETVLLMIFAIGVGGFVIGTFLPSLQNGFNNINAAISGKFTAANAIH